MLAARAGFEKAWNRLSATRTEGHFELWRQDRDFHAWKDRMHDERLRCRAADRRDRPLLLRGRDHQRLGARACPDGALRHKMFTMVSIPKMVALGQSFLQSTAQSCHRCLRPELFRFERSAVAELERAAISKRTKKALNCSEGKGQRSRQLSPYRQDQAGGGSRAAHDHRDRATSRRGLPPTS
jgi:hypothetical protein